MLIYLFITRLILVPLAVFLIVYGLVNLVFAVLDYYKGV